ncbi:protein Spindly-like [Pogonomyrmex barbatus]|uniref:Protein Spindly-like n=1 Tax=Pogonomyrmex barbatus TaxID=144034 RepID=A0A6I9WZG0_9HYME|nr:protein Spindly-like [Pogonomyrmex barbatus]XP_011648278.1 protein Spindly-like [Pogonomyrmex barbatus]
MSELYDKSTNDTKMEEHLEESSISQDDYKKLKQENECYRQELYVLRLKLEAGEAVRRDLQESVETAESQLSQYIAKTESMLAQKEEKHRAEKKEYENHIADLEANKVQSTLEIKQLHEELRKYKDLTNEQPNCLTSMDDTLLLQYEEKIKELTLLLQNEEKKREPMENRLAFVEARYKELKESFTLTLDQLQEKSNGLESARESITILTTKLVESQLSNIIPASDTCKGNSLFAEVEDNRLMLLDKMKSLQSKYKEKKRTLNAKMTEIKLLKAEKAVMARKWESDAIDTLQENTDLLNKYKSRVSELENKLKKIKKDNVEEIQSTDDAFNYAQTLLAAKKKEMKELYEKIEKQAMQILRQEEVNHNVSKELRHWRSKAMSLEAQIQAIKMHLEMEQANDDNKALLEAIENCKISDNVNFEKTCDSKSTCDMPKDNKHQENLTESSKKSAADSTNEQKESNKKVLHFAMNTKDTESKPLKKQSKQYDYPIVSITDDDS